MNHEGVSQSVDESMNQLTISESINQGIKSSPYSLVHILPTSSFPLALRSPQLLATARIKRKNAPIPPVSCVSWDRALAARAQPTSLSSRVFRECCLSGAFWRAETLFWRPLGQEPHCPKKCRLPRRRVVSPATSHAFEVLNVTFPSYLMMGGWHDGVLLSVTIVRNLEVFQLNFFWEPDSFDD